MSFAKRESALQVEEGSELAPKFDENGLIPCVTQQAETREILMFAYRNAEATLAFPSADGDEAPCHVGYRNCFYRSIELGKGSGQRGLVFIEKEKAIDSEAVYGDAPNPTQL